MLLGSHRFQRPGLDRPRKSCSGEKVSHTHRMKAQLLLRPRVTALPSATVSSTRKYCRYSEAYNKHRPHCSPLSQVWLINEFITCSQLRGAWISAHEMLLLLFYHFVFHHFSSCMWKLSKQLQRVHLPLHFNYFKNMYMYQMVAEYIF